MVTGGEYWINNKQLVATIEPSNVTEKEVTWKSSNLEIATVDNTGLVKAGTKGGEVTITATTKDGSNRSAECKIVTELFGKVNVNETAYTDSDGNTVKIPDGYAVGTSVNVNKVIGGLVAQDNEGNQFVWIPVGDVKESGTTTFNVALGRYAFEEAQSIPELPVQTQANYSEAVNIDTNYQEAIKQTGSNAHAKALQKFIDNSTTDGGYWFGRYEASNNSGARSKYDKEAWGSITQSKASTAAKNMKPNGAYKSDLVNSYAWDTAIIFIEKSGHTGYIRQTSKNSEKLNTGRSKDQVCNIYDMASNCREWTTETNTDTSFCCTNRGGDCGDSGFYTSYRSAASTGFSLNRISFRCILFKP